MHSFSQNWNLCSIEPILGKEVIPRGCQALCKALVWALPASLTSTIASTPPRTLSGSHLGTSFTYWRWASSWELALHERFFESGSIGTSFRLCLNSRQSSSSGEETVHSCMPGLYPNSLVVLFPCWFLFSTFVEIQDAVSTYLGELYMRQTQETTAMVSTFRFGIRSLETATLFFCAGTSKPSWSGFQVRKTNVTLNVQMRFECL